MRSNKDHIIAALDAAEASYRELAALPLEALTRPEKTELLKRLREIDKKMAALDRRLFTGFWWIHEARPPAVYLCADKPVPLIAMPSHSRWFARSDRRLTP
jgi:hypothetical protein